MFNSGDDFPGDKHRERIMRYDRHRKIIKGLYDAASGVEMMIGSLGTSDYLHGLKADTLLSLLGEVRVVANLPKVIARRQAGMATRGMRLQVDGERESADLEAALDDSQWSRLRRQMVFRNRVYGNGVATVRREVDGRVYIDTRDPWTWFPEIDQYNPADATAHTIAWQLTRSDVDYLLQEHHEAGRIIRSAHELRTKGGRYDHGNDHDLVRDLKLGDKVNWTDFYPDLSEEEFTGIPLPLVVVLRSWTDDESVFGDGMLSGNESLVFEITNRLSQIARILDKHAEPKLTGPESARRRTPDGLVYMDVSSSYLPVEPGDAPYGYLTWESQLENAQKELDRVIGLLCIQMDMSPELLGLNLSGGAGVEATDTLRIRSFSTLAAIEDERAFMQEGLQELGKLILIAKGHKNASTVNVQYEDPIPQSQTERATAVQVERLAGTLSRERAIEKLNPDMTEEEIARELERIAGEESAMFNPGQF